MRILLSLGIILIAIISCDDPQSSNNLPGNVHIHSPLDGSTVSENVSISFTIPGSGAVKMVELWVNDLPDTRDLIRPFNLDWSTASREDSLTHTLFVRVYYADNRRLDSEKIQLTVDNSASYPTKPRIISITYQNEEFNLRWVRNEDEDFYAYYLYESDNADMSGAVVYGPFTSRQTTSRTIPNMKEKVRYYQLATRDIYGLERFSEIAKGSGLGKIIFISDRNLGQDIYQMSSDGSDVINISNSDLYEQYAQHLNEVSKIIYTSGSNENQDIFIMSEDGSNPQNLTNHSGIDTEPNVSDDHQSIVFTTNRGTDFDIYTMDLSGNNLNRITGNLANDFTPKFISAGSRIVFVTDRNGQEDIYSIKTDGSAEERITFSSADDKYPLVFPNGNRLLFVSNRDGNDNLYTMNFDGTDMQRLTSLPGDEVNPCFSEDGNEIAFQYNENNKSQIYLMSVDSSQPINITLDNISEANPVFSPNNFYIYFQSRRDGNKEIYRVNRDGTQQLNLTKNPAEDVLPDLFGLRLQITNYAR